MPTLFSSTLPKPLEPPLKPKLFQRTCKAKTEKKIVFKKFPDLSKK